VTRFVEVGAEQFAEQGEALAIACPDLVSVADDAAGDPGGAAAVERADGLRQEDERSILIQRDLHFRGDGSESSSAVEVGEAVAAGDAENDVGALNVIDGGVWQAEAAGAVNTPKAVVFPDSSGADGAAQVNMEGLAVEVGGGGAMPIAVVEQREVRLVRALGNGVQQADGEGVDTEVSGAGRGAEDAEAWCVRIGGGDPRSLTMEGRRVRR